MEENVVFHLGNATTSSLAWDFKQVVERLMRNSRGGRRASHSKGEQQFQWGGGRVMGLANR